MPAHRLKQFLESKNVAYQTIEHPPATTALETADKAHVAVQEMAKTVMVLLDGKMAMAVLPASCDVNMDELCGLAGAESIEKGAVHATGLSKIWWPWNKHRPRLAFMAGMRSKK